MTDAHSEMTIFTKTYDFLAWIVPQTNHFPRSHRYTITQRLQNAAMNFLERLVEANNARDRQRMGLLVAADAELDKVRFYLRLAHHWRWLSEGQYEHAGRMVTEMGRLLGGWQKTTRQQLA